MICTGCGAENRPGATFCSHCGKSLQAVQGAQGGSRDRGATFRSQRGESLQGEPIYQQTAPSPTPPPPGELRSQQQQPLRQAPQGAAKDLTTRKALAEKYKSRMIRGLLWTIAGIVITAISYSIAEEQGSTYLICWGAVLFGIIDFLAGLVGWLRYQL